MQEAKQFSPLRNGFHQIRKQKQKLARRGERSGKHAKADARTNSQATQDSKLRQEAANSHSISGEVLTESPGLSLDGADIVSDEGPPFAARGTPPPLETAKELPLPRPARRVLRLSNSQSVNHTPAPTGPLVPHSIAGPPYRAPLAPAFPPPYFFALPHPPLQAPPPMASLQAPVHQHNPNSNENWQAQPSPYYAPHPMYFAPTPAYFHNGFQYSTNHPQP
ncbi:hypothetical protein SCHPADRAFT_938613 [Schizopora paradoxa]|uniref:Uncharacterized protein n=1 Tax=Schizopora paradoxa TaxID=27342 RepID=A0A0H2RUX6_9AGAM|nr:hypothetical protein SCHPADRAFT_938613 [Schizopora paradoxa]